MATVTSVVAMMAPVIWCMLFLVASSGERSSVSRMRIVFSTTMMPSSTRDPITRIRPNMVSTLMEKPKGSRMAKVPIRETGMASAGMSVARQSCRNRYVMPTTRIRAMTSVSTISAMVAEMHCVGS